MTDSALNTNLKKRYRAEKRFRLYCFSALSLAILILVTLLGSITFTAIPAFTQTHILLDHQLDDEDIGLFNDEFDKISWRSSHKDALKNMFPNVSGRSEKKELYKLISSASYEKIKKYYQNNPEKYNTLNQILVPAADDIDLIYKNVTKRDLPENMRTVSDVQLERIDQLSSQSRIKTTLAWKLFTNGDINSSNWILKGKW